MPRLPLPPNVTRLPRPGHRLVAVLIVRKVEREDGSEAVRIEMAESAGEGAEVKPFRKEVEVRRGKMRQTDRFEAVSSDGRRFWIVQEVEEIRVTAEGSSPSGTMDSIPSYRTEDGRTANALGKGEFEILGLGVKVKRV